MKLKGGLGDNGSLNIVPESILIKVEDLEEVDNLELDMIVGKGKESIEIKDENMDLQVDKKFSKLEGIENAFRAWGNSKTEDMNLKEDLFEEQNEYAKQLAEECDDDLEDKEKVSPNKKDVDEDYEPEVDTEDEDDIMKDVDSKDQLSGELKGFKGSKEKEVRGYNCYKDSNLPLVTQLRAQIKNLRTMLNRSKKQNRKTNTPTEAKIKKWMREYIAKHHSRAWANFICDGGSSNTGPGHYNDREILKAVGLMRISKKAYNYVRDNRLCPLPNDTTLSRWSKVHPDIQIPTSDESVGPTETKEIDIDQPQSAAKVNPCGTCGANFTKKALLNQHLGEVHGDEKARKLQCKVCGKWLSDSDNMLAHQNMHMGIKPVKCTFCDRTYRKRGNMQAHRRQAHAEEWMIKRQEDYSNWTNGGLGFNSWQNSISSKVAEK